MPRPRKPVETLQATGAFRPDRHTLRAAAPKSALPIGDPPPSLAPAEAACRLVARSRGTGLLPAELGHLRALLSELGASPASRGRVQTARPAEAPAANPWDAPGQARN
jgi:hypothetical protein